MPTVETAFRRWIPFVNLDEAPTIPLGIVFQLAHELTPADIGYSLTKAPIPYHVLHRQALDTDRLVFTDQAHRELVQEVLAAVGNASVNTRDFETSFVLVIRPPLLFSITPLRFRQFLFIHMEELRIANGLTVGEHDEGFQAKIGTDGLAGDRWPDDVLLDKQADEVAVSTVLRDGNTRRISTFRQGTRPADVQRFFHLCQRYASRSVREGRPRVLGALVIALLFERWITASALKEADKRPVQVTKRLLGRNARYFVQPRVFILLLQVSEHRGEVFVVQSPLLFVVGIRLKTQSPVVCDPRTTECLSKDTLLLVSRIKSKLVRSCPYIHVLHFNSYCVKTKGLEGGQQGQTYCGTSQFLLALKVLGFLATRL